MNHRPHWISNFPPRYPLWKQLIANAMYAVGNIRLTARPNFLTQEDIDQARALAQPGDVLLVGGLRRVSKFFIGTPFTHTMVYKSEGTCIHAYADGAEEVSLEEVGREYDTLLLLRHREATRESMSSVTAHAERYIGTPFDFEFTTDDSKVYCSELVYRSFAEAGIETGIRPRPRMYPPVFINEHFVPIFSSAWLTTHFPSR